MSCWEDAPTGRSGGIGDSGGSFGTSGGHGLGSAGDDFGGGKGGNDGLCFHCQQPGHSKIDCPNPRVFSGTCRICQKEGHMARHCPDRPQHDGLMKCYRCSEEGHSSRDCALPMTCKECNAEGHTVKDCPVRVCKNCGQPGHSIPVCEAPRMVDRSHFPDLPIDKIWKNLKKAVDEREIEDVKSHVQTYFKAKPEMTYVEFEKLLRSQNIGVWLIALERMALAPTLTNMDPQGNLEKKYTVNYRFEPTPLRPREREGWPTTEENFERLADAGEVVDRGLPKCSNCEGIGHTRKTCPQEPQESDTVRVIKCYNCEGEGHRVRDCPVPRVDKFACRNCGQAGHKVAECPEPPNLANVECRKCSEMGHFSRDCPQGGGGDRGCRNCGAKSHMARECPQPLDMTKVQCRNCDEFGHQSRECPKPRDYSRVTCQNCGEKGHTKVRCKTELKEDAGFDNDSGGGGFDNIGGGGFDNWGGGGGGEWGVDSCGGGGGRVNW